MNTSLYPSWIEEKQAELQAMEWGWRALDDLSWRGGPERIDQVDLGMNEKETEIRRLRAELAVASFVEEFYTTQRTEIGRSLVVSARVRSWKNPRLTRQQLADLVMREATRTDGPWQEMRWEPPTSTPGETKSEWWVDLEAVSSVNGREHGRLRYRFLVVDDNVDSWVLVGEWPQDEEVSIALPA